MALDIFGMFVSTNNGWLQLYCFVSLLIVLFYINQIDLEILYYISSSIMLSIEEIWIFFPSTDCYYPKRFDIIWVPRLCWSIEAIKTKLFNFYKIKLSEDILVPQTELWGISSTTYCGTPCTYTDSPRRWSELQIPFAPRIAGTQPIPCIVAHPATPKPPQTLATSLAL